MNSHNPLQGTWSLKAWYNEAPDGEKRFPLGADATGYISYSEDGLVFVHISAAHRTHFALDDPFAGSASEDSSAMKSHITYAGPYRFYGDHVVHHVTQASCPNWLGTQQRRAVAFRDDVLRLSAEAVAIQGQTATAIVDWTRARS